MGGVEDPWGGMEDLRGGGGSEKKKFSPLFREKKFSKKFSSYSQLVSYLSKAFRIENPFIRSIF